MATKVQEVFLTKRARSVSTGRWLIAYNHGTYFSLGEHLGFWDIPSHSPEALAPQETVKAPTQKAPSAGPAEGAFLPERRHAGGFAEATEP